MQVLPFPTCPKCKTSDSVRLVSQNQRDKSNVQTFRCQCGWSTDRTVKADEKSLSSRVS